MSRRIAYCRRIPYWPVDKQEAYHIENGVPKGYVYIEGRGAESFDAVVNACRDGFLVEVVEFRVLGGSVTQMRENYGRLHGKGAGVLEVTTDRKSTDHGPQLFHDAERKIRGTRRSKGPTEMRRRAKKAHKARRKRLREQRMPDEEAAEIWWSGIPAKDALDKINADERYAIKWTRATAFRRLKNL